MKCVICHGDDVRATDTHEDLVVAKDIVRVPVQALVCRTCGERYYDRRTIRHLEEVRKELQAGKEGLLEVGKILVYR